MAILKLIVMNFIVGYLWHISMTMVFLLVTVYVTGSSRFKSEKIQQYVTKMGIMKNIIYYSGTGKASPITFDSMFPFFNTVILFESMNDITFVINHELAHIKQNHTLKHFILTVLIGILVTIICDKILWWENWLIDIVAGQILGRMFEKEADTISIKCTSTEELYKAISMFNLMKKEKCGTGFFEKITYYMDIHPTEKDRIALIKKELIQRAKNEAQLVYLNDLNA